MRAIARAAAPDAKAVTSDAHFVLARAAEAFLGELAARSAAQASARGGADGVAEAAGTTIEYDDVAEGVRDWEPAAEFLVPAEVVPRRVLASELMAKQKREEEEQKAGGGGGGGKSGGGGGGGGSKGGAKQQQKEAGSGGGAAGGKKGGKK